MVEIGLQNVRGEKDSPRTNPQPSREVASAGPDGSTVGFIQRMGEKRQFPVCIIRG